MLHTKFRGNLPACSEEEDFLKGFYHIWAFLKHPLFSLFPIEKPKLPNLTLP